jgi:hypothetical protein
MHDVKWCHPKLAVEVKHLAGSKTLWHATVRKCSIGQVRQTGAAASAHFILLELTSLQRIAFLRTLMRHQTEGEFL